MKVYEFLAEKADRRSKDYKHLDKQLDYLTNKYGKESKQVNDFFNQDLKTVLNKAI